jgi:hypothetical protein
VPEPKIGTVLTAKFHPDHFRNYRDICALLFDGRSEFGMLASTYY